MTIPVADPWHARLDRDLYPTLFLSRDDVTSATPQAHLLRHAFDVLDLDGIFCTDGAPLVFFKHLESFEREQTLSLHRRFWNHGGAPLLTLVSKDRAEIYSGTSRPVSPEDAGASRRSLITTLDELATALPQFLISVETGEFFRSHSRSFDPSSRVDRDLLASLGAVRDRLSGKGQSAIPVEVLDALLCRLVFTCYLFDRNVVGEAYLADLGLEPATHLRDVLSLRPLVRAKEGLFRLFRQLSADFNGDLFSDDVDAEAAFVTLEHIEVLDQFFHGTQIRTGQRAFWPYDFQYIPIETISAIYEHFLKSEDHEDGAFYTPRFLAEIVIDSAIEGFDTLLDKRFLDPACGSGIFLVGLFNRIAEEWKSANPKSPNDRRARELARILQNNLYGVDINRTACRITAFSLYLAYLDQLSPRDIQGLQRRGRALPHLISEQAGSEDPSAVSESAGTIRRADFFDGDAFAGEVDLIVGNPPWGSTAAPRTAAGRWCADNDRPLPDNQIAAAFIWKAAEHVSTQGRVSFVLPHGILFNHSPAAVRFQKSWVGTHRLEQVLNLADLRLFLFNEAIHPALVIRYRPQAPTTDGQSIEYLTPKADWTITQAEVIVIQPSDRRSIPLDRLLNDLESEDAPQLWSQSFWGSQRDLRLLDRLLLYPRLRDHIRLPSEKDSPKRWVRAEGFQPPSPGDDLARAKLLRLPSTRFIQARHPSIDLFITEDDCEKLNKPEVLVRNRSNTSTDVFRAPHVLITKGFKRIAYADFDVSFRHALRGIHGPREDRALLIFLAAYLRTRLARYVMFHTSSNWGVYRPEVHVQEILRLPLPLPEQHRDPARASAIIDEVVAIVEQASTAADHDFLSRNALVQSATERIEPLVLDYFDLQEPEKVLVDDTNDVIMPSIQPTRSRHRVPTMAKLSPESLSTYTVRICDTLNGWARATTKVSGSGLMSDRLGVAVAALVRDGHGLSAPSGDDEAALIQTLDRLLAAAPKTERTVAFARGLTVFDGPRLYIVKPATRRHWTQSCALNDADQIAGALLSYRSRAAS